MKLFKIANEPAPFLSTPEKAWIWAKENVDISITEDSLNDPSLPDFQKAAYERDIENNIELAETYSYKYNQIKNSNNLVVYRAIRVLSLDDVNWSKIGTHWSFEKNGTGCYGCIDGIVNQKGIVIVLTGVTSPKNIDWEYSFTSFMYYGRDQWECSFNEGSNITITHINDEKINPINAIA